MKRFYLVLAAGLCSFTQARAQQGSLAPTVPIVPAPVVQNGNLMNSGGGVTGGRSLALANWSPFRNPATASDGSSVTAPPMTLGAPLPPLPAGMSCSAGPCTAGGCAGGHNGSCWAKFKAWLCYHQSNTSLPRCCPTPYQTPLQGMFPCAGGEGGCASCGGPVFGQPGSPSGTQPPPTMQPPMQVGTMPARGTQGAAFAPTWQGRVTPAYAGAGIAAYSGTATAGGVVNTGGNMPQR